MKTFLKIAVIFTFILLCNNYLFSGCKKGPAKNNNKDRSCDLKNKNTDCKKGYSCMYTGIGKNGTSCVKCDGKECDNSDECKESGKGTTCYKGICRTFAL